MSIKRHTCTAYCRGTRHADIVWSPPEIPMSLVGEHLRRDLPVFGCSFLAIEPAHEARQDREVEWIESETLRPLTAAEAFPPDYVPYLYLYEKRGAA